VFLRKVLFTFRGIYCFGMNNILQQKTLLVLGGLILGGALLYVGVSRSGNETPTLVSEPVPAVEEMETITNGDVSSQEESTTTTVISTPSPEVVAPVTPKPVPVVAPVKVDPAPVPSVVQEDPVLTPVEPPTGITMIEVAQHTDTESCWSVINGGVYDLTSYIPRHPGGKSEILAICGKDGSRLFEGQHSGDSKPEKILAGFYLNVLVD
jgi:Cytochrome b5-like Heme/Steroid binding domain